MFAGVLSRVGWFKRPSKEDLPTSPLERHRFPIRPLNSSGVPNAFSPLQFEGLSAAERFRRCRASVERRCKARARFEPGQIQRQAMRKAAP